jgi:hypothetical protein
MIGIDPKFIGSISTGLAAKLSGNIARSLGTKGIQKFQRLMSASDFIAGIFGLDNIEDQPQPLLGGISLREAQATYKEMEDADLARGNLFFIEVFDPNPPELGIGGNGPPKPETSVDPVTAAASAALSGFKSGLAGGILGQVAAKLQKFGLSLPSSPAGVAGPSPDIPHLFNLFATSVSYSGVELTSERTVIGGASMDKLTGKSGAEVTITTMDDGIGSLKRWFEGKSDQAVHSNGTVGVPRDYCVFIRVFHATPKAHSRAYASLYRMRTKSMSFDLNRREQALQEVTMTFEEHDTFMGTSLQSTSVLF